MKIRNGFVSNSSSSSFVVIGFRFNYDEIDKLRRFLSFDLTNLRQIILKAIDDLNNIESEISDIGVTDAISKMRVVASKLAIEDKPNSSRIPDFIRHLDDLFNGCKVKVFADNGGEDMDYLEGVCIGLPFSDMGDGESKDKFLSRIREEVENKLGQEMLVGRNIGECSGEESYYSRGEDI